MKAKLSDLVRLPGGEVAKLSDLIDNGTMTLHKCENFYRRGNRTSVAYLAETEDGYAVEINRTAYEYRTAGKTHLDAIADRLETGELISDKSMSDGEFLAPLLDERP